MSLRRFSSVAICGLAVFLMSGCASVRLDVPAVPSHAIADGADTALGRAFAEQSSRHPNLSGFQVVALGHAAFVARTALADLAESTLDLQYYSVSDNLTTDLLLSRIVAAAERGVSEVIGPQPQIAPQKHRSFGLWQGGIRRCGRPM